MFHTANAGCAQAAKPLGGQAADPHAQNRGGRRSWEDHTESTGVRRGALHVVSCFLCLCPPRAFCCFVLVIPALFSPKSIALCSSVLFAFRIRRRCIQLSEEIPWRGEET